MMNGQQRKYPIGIQTFSEIREKDYWYVDKTEYVYRMAQTAKYLFLSRPRRFGKSLLTSTLRCYFEGRRELFRGLAMERLETEWTVHPVLHFDMSTAKHADCARLTGELERKLAAYEQVYGRGENDIEPNQRLEGLIFRAWQQTGRQVVVLIDEYDAPLLDVVHEDTRLTALRRVMRNFYSPLKACEPYLRFVFLTGITKFSQLSIFSELNSVKNISMDPEFAAACGITADEIVTQLSPALDSLSARMGISRDETMERLRDNYDGYHFTWPSADIYNPYSLVNAMADGKLKAYWFASGTPTSLVEMLRKYPTLPQQIGGRKCVETDFNTPVELVRDITPLLYQSGYITIKGYSPVSELYLLDIPNREVRIGLMRTLLGCYVQNPAPLNTLVGEMAECLFADDMDGALQRMQTVLSTVPYCDNTHYEGHYQQMLYLLFTLLGHYVDVEVRTPRGRVDVVARTHTTLYVIELKIDVSAADALRQIELKNYAERFALCGLPVVRVGVSFDSTRRTIGGWEIDPRP